MAKTMIVIGLRSPVLALVLLGVSQTGGQVFTRNATRAEVAYAAALGEARPELSTTRVSRTGSSQWVGGAYASISAAVDLVFATPFDSEAVLIVNPVTGATDTTVLGGFSNDVGKWSGMAFCPTTDKLCKLPNQPCLSILCTVLGSHAGTTHIRSPGRTQICCLKKLR